LGIGWHRRRTDLLRQAGVDGVGSTQLLGAQVVCAALVGLVVLLLTGALAVAVCFAGFAFVAPITVLRGTRRRRMAALRELWPEAIDHLASAVRAGMSLPEGG
jgi:tight adherence protein B